MNLNIFIAFFAGIISFLSPCIFPIIPSYIGYIGAATYDEGYKKQKGAIPLILSFILGFTIVFTLMGIAFSSLGIAFSKYSVLITKISGILVVILGLNIMFNFIAFLDYEKKVHVNIKQKGILSSLFLGMGFGAGWSPCIGPILASILFLAGNSETLLNGVILLFTFSLGLGVPFFISGLFIANFRDKTQFIKNNLGKIRFISGIFIIIIGVLIFLNKVSNINIQLINFSTWYMNKYNNYATMHNISISIVFMTTAYFTGRSFLKIVKHKRKLAPIMLVPISFMIVSIASIFNLINWGELLMKYLTFQGI